MPKAEKVEKVKAIKQRLESAEAAYFADYRGLSVPDIGEVRTALLDAEAQLSVLKNTLTRLAVRDLGKEELEAFIEGPTAVAFVQGDIVLGAKALVDAAKKFPVLEVKGGLAEGRVLSADQVKELAALDTREEMLATVAGMLSAHLRKAAYLFQALQTKFLLLLKAYEEGRQEAEGTEPEAQGEKPEGAAADAEPAAQAAPAEESAEPAEEAAEPAAEAAEPAEDEAEPAGDEAAGQQEEDEQEEGA